MLSDSCMEELARCWEGVRVSGGQKWSIWSFRGNRFRLQIETSSIFSGSTLGSYCLFLGL